MVFIGRAIGVVLLLSIACRGDDILTKLEKQMESFASPSSSSSSSAESSASAARAPEMTAPSFIGAPIASNLAKLISNALKGQTESAEETQKEELKVSSTTVETPERKTEVTEKVKDEAAEVLDDSSSDTTSDDDVTRSDTDVSGSTRTTDSPSSSTTFAEKENSASSAEESKLDFAPASSEQFGELGPGSKLMEYLPNFSQMSIETNSIAGVAGAGAVALMALGAIFAVPVAPAILRRTGTKGWSGLPSWRDLFSWWNSPDPVAEAWADKHQHQYEYETDYNEGAYYANGQQQQYYTYDATGSSSNQQHNFYADTNLVKFVAQEPSPAPAPDYENVNTYVATVNYPHHQHQQQPHQQQPHQQHQQRMQEQEPPHQHQQQDPDRLEAETYVGFRRVQRPSVDGHEYVTLEQLNRIGEESVKLLGELAKGYSTEDLYAYRDGNNQLRRRNLHAFRQSSPQYQPEPSYHESVQHFRETYLQEDEEEGETHTNHKEGLEGYHNKKVFSLTQPGHSQEHAEEEEEEEPPSYEYEPKYTYSYSPSNTGIESTSAFHQEDQNGEQSLHKVSEFPYQFHTEP